jgi:hypothetical protein
MRRALFSAATSREVGADWADAEAPRTATKTTTEFQSSATTEARRKQTPALEPLCQAYRGATNSDAGEASSERTNKPPRRSKFSWKDILMPPAVARIALPKKNSAYCGKSKAAAAATTSTAAAECSRRLVIAKTVARLTVPLSERI